MEDVMHLTGGVVLFLLGIGLVLLARPRRHEDVRPFMRSAFGSAIIPPLCLALMTLGVAIIITNL
jgi:hypothetical protein